LIYIIYPIVVGLSLITIYYLYFLYIKNKNKGPITWNKAPTNKKISIIIATYNEEDTIENKLKNIMDLNYDKNNIETYIMDSGSIDKTVEIVNMFIAANPDRNFVFDKEKERMGKSHALNIAYKKATGEIKIISDADAVLEKDSVQNVVNCFNDPLVGAACGRQILLNASQSDTTVLEQKYRDFYQILREGESKIDSTPIFHGELSAYRSELIDVLPENKSADDSRLANLIRFKGYRSVYDSEATFYEYAPIKWGSRLTQKVRRAQGLIRLFWDLKGGLFRGSLGSYGRLILPFEFSIHCIFPTIWIMIFITYI
jgi:poly-beta-1,6-N-acetyl-D-glucosamine synthase